MKLVARVGTVEKDVSLEPLEGAPGRFTVTLGERERTVDARALGPTTWSLLLGDEVVLVDVEPGKDGELLCDVRGTVVAVKMVDARRKLLERAQRAAPAAHGPTDVGAPMPGKVIKLLVKPGDAVTAGQGVAVVEAMKMENEVRAARAGTVQAVHVKEGQAVEGQEPLLTIA
jgi:biotin carboxyl carrier protein